METRLSFSVMWPSNSECSTFGKKIKFCLLPAVDQSSPAEVQYGAYFILFNMNSAWCTEMSIMDGSVWSTVHLSSNNGLSSVRLTCEVFIQGRRSIRLTRGFWRWWSCQRRPARRTRRSRRWPSPRASERILSSLSAQRPVTVTFSGVGTKSTLRGGEGARRARSSRAEPCWGYWGR